MILWQLPIVGVFSFGLSWLAVRWSISLARRLNFLDHPDDARKLQNTPIPRLGGLAVALALSVAVTSILAITGNWQEITLVGSVLVPGILAALIGFADDQRNLNPYVRLSLQALVGITAWILGTQVSISGLPTIDFLISVLWVMVIINGINLLDNSDGLAGSTVIIASVSSLVISLIFHQELVPLLATCLIGTTAGFLVFNWHPARVYLGDSGAYFLGTLLALLVIRLRPEGVEGGPAAAIAILVVTLPLLDTSFVVVRRLSKGTHPFTAGRDHLSHELQSRGVTIPVSVGLLQLVPIIGGVSAVALAALVSS